MIIHGDYNYYIVVLSVIIAILASYSALSITSKISNSKGKMQLFWLFAGALVMGAGIWSMHFVGMLAFHVHTIVEYDVWLTVLSMVASVLSSFVAFYITKPKNVSRLKIAFGGFFMGSGIITMHYVGMEAMIMPMDISYDPLLWILSAIIAYAASYAALFLFLKFRNQASVSWLKWISSIVMGFAVCGMHYTGMKAATFTGDEDYLSHGGHVHMTMDDHAASVDLFLLYGVTVATFVILLVSWGALFLDRHVLERMAYEDSLTGLPNRNEMNRFFDTYAGDEELAVLFLDLDQFKAINDTLGHDIGDLLIQEVGSRLQQFVDVDLQAYRIGGDEFLFIIKNCSLQQAKAYAERVIKEIKKVHRIEGNELYVTGSIGISIGSIQHTERSSLLKTADTAMYKAKGLGKNQYCIYTEDLGVNEVRKMELEKDLLLAIEQQQFYMVYQPKCNVRTNSLVGFEALIRWQHPRLGQISPAEFIPIAEETGLVIPMTKWVLLEACRQCKEWQTQGIHQPISVNLSVRLFQTDNLTELIPWVLEETGLEPEMLELEITESMVFHNINDIIQQLHKIRNSGVRVSMDDFGTGYSSIGLLDRLPLDSLKLDRLFTYDLDTPSKRAIVHAIILMAEKLQLEVIAEGVENEEHIEFLTELGCYVMQGYYYGKPMKNERIGQWVRDFNVPETISS
ncbi:bifunctional diguanylate cyclase/phosphodiesterase [Paenibacillus sp. 453mf]|uniref:bifunctional diguanylate cyclase/phosphodiesterase n=1 Tax=Paenibacillus sp. 453mf TaxID=1761874 RepID=UPI0008E71239|nr:bifunctional diguanylate cyclase/phosphodiesterase [Paenibacillus sp. 453mf]SFS56923.1 diguanylate cyclase (GGDEF) domain-containing protein [Paenibacillus sp. 453mf]